MECEQIKALMQNLILDTENEKIATAEELIRQLVKGLGFAKETELNTNGIKQPVR